MGNLADFGIKTILDVEGVKNAGDILDEISREYNGSKVNFDSLISKLYNDNKLTIFEMGYLLSSFLTEAYIKNGHISISDYYPVQMAYYKISPFIRKYIKKLFFNKMLTFRKRYTTNFPLDTTGYTLINLLIETIKKRYGDIKKSPKWPNKYTTAFSFTFDIEPSPYIKKSLPLFLEFIYKNNIPATFSITSDGTKYLTPFREALSKFEIISHNKNHSGITPYLNYKRMVNILKTSKDELEQSFSKPVIGYRSPRLSRSRQLFTALEETGYKFSSTLIDVDYERPQTFGSGISFNYPFFHPSLSLLEIPITAPDGIFPLYLGYTENEMYQMYKKKISFINEIGGIYVSIIHPEFLYGEDITRRFALLKFIYNNIQGKKNIWIADLEEIYKWWKFERKDYGIS